MGKAFLKRENGGERYYHDVGNRTTQIRDLDFFSIELERAKTIEDETNLPSIRDDVLIV